MLASGRSLSGRERNCCFLNTGASRFADISATAGIDFPDDARGMAIVDWDGDGDLDVWVTNRTSPRVRFLKNNYDAEHHFLALKLQGVRCNRDGIGARVEVKLDTNATLFKSHRAGDGYLGQSSKWLHFGLGRQTSVVRVIVHWPGGDREEFRNLEADRRYLLVQGSEVGREQAKCHDHVQLRPTTPKKVPVSPASKRIVLPARLPLPALAYRDFTGHEISLTTAAAKRPLLINLWATWCQPCLQEISQWVVHKQEFDKSATQIVLLCVDEALDAAPREPSQAKQLLARLQVPFRAGFATTDALDKLDVAQQVLTKRIRPLPVPSSFLVDDQGRLAVVYKGPTSVEQVLQDIRNLSRPAHEIRDLAAAFPGRWYTHPFPPDLLAIPRRYRELGQPGRALDYLIRHVEDAELQPSQPESLHENISSDNLAELFVGLGLLLQQQGDRVKVIESLQSAVRVQPKHVKARLALAMIYQQDGRPNDAVQQYRKVLEFQPGDPVVSNNLAWLLATSPDATVRASQEAIRLAQDVCRRSNRQFPPALDTLAAAYASAGDYERARVTAREAINLLQQRDMNDASEQLRHRLSLYERGQPFFDKTIDASR